jgi:hypothetical protein
MKAVIKWGLISVGAITLAIVVGFVVLVAIVAVRMPQDELLGTEQGSTPKQVQESAQKVSEEPQSGKTGNPVDLVQADVESYYSAASSGDYIYTYEQLSSVDRQNFTQEQWTAANTNLASDTTEYQIQDIVKAAEGVYDVTLTITSTGETRGTQFIYEGGRYVHKLTSEEINMFAQAAGASASATASASASASAAPSSGGDVQVRVVIEATEPVDVSIFDDTFSTSINEQVTSETYEFTMSENSGLSASASTEDMFTGDVSIEVYEDGELVSEDQAEGMALVQY